MCRNRRDRRKSNGIVVLATGRVRKGLPFVARLSMHKILLGILARAQSLYPVKVCAFIFMGNHHHLILSGHSCHISPFMNYVQGEIARAIERLIPGVYEGTVWEERYKEQILATPDDVIEKMAYIYLNPVRAKLVKRAAEYPGLGSYKYLDLSRRALLCKWIKISSLSALPEGHDRKQDIEICRNLITKAKSSEELCIDPYAWLSCFKGKLSKQTVLERVKSLVEETEKGYALSSVLGVEELIAQGLRKPFAPKSKSPTPHLICCDKELRLELILSYRYFCQQCRDAWENFKRGLAYVWPKGAFKPSMRWRLAAAS